MSNFIRKGGSNEPEKSISVVSGLSITFTLGQEPSEKLDTPPLIPWKDHPQTTLEWERFSTMNRGFIEPPMKHLENRKPAAGVLILEPDLRIWVIHQTELYSSARLGFPVGRQETGLSLQAVATRESWEQTGLQIRITAWLGDFDQIVTRTRLYLAERIGGSPAACSWSNQTLSLMPLAVLQQLPNQMLASPVSEGLESLKNILNMTHAMEGISDKDLIQR